VIRLSLAEFCNLVIEDLAAYTGVSVNEAVHRIVKSQAQKVLADAWRKSNPQLPEEVDRYYRSQVAYIDDLAWFNAQPNYWLQNTKLLEVEGYVADFGGGIGSLAMALSSIGCRTAYIDLPSPQRSFAEWRFKQHGLPIGVHESLSELKDLDAIVSTDTVEHLHPDTLPAVIRQMWDVLKPDGQVRTINKFGKNDIWPMHYDSKELFEKAMKDTGFSGGPVIWWKNGEH